MLGIAASSSIAMRDRPARPARRDVGQEQGDADADGDGDDQRDRRSDERSVDRHERAELAADRVPVGTGDEAQPNVWNASRPPHAIDSSGRAEQQQHEPGSAGGDQLEEHGRRRPPLAADAVISIGSGRRVHLTFWRDVALDLLHERHRAAARSRASLAWSWPFSSA